MSYFNNFPKINYFNEQSRNIILKSAIVSQVINNVDSFYPYVIKEYQRPDLIAYYEYDDPLLDWVVYLSNNIVDPYYDWPLSSEDFTAYLKKKYNKTIYEIQSEIIHYKYTGLTNESAEDIARKSWFMTPTTHSLIGDTSGWSPVYTYDYEVELNEAKRSIRLLNKIYIPQIKAEIKEIFTK